MAGTERGDRAGDEWRDGEEKREQASLWYQLRRNKGLVLLAMIGVILASWQFLKRS